MTTQFAVPIFLTPWDGFTFGGSFTVDGYMQRRNPLTGRVFWVNRHGRVRGNKELANG